MSVFFKMEDHPQLNAWIYKRATKIYASWKHDLHRHYVKYDHLGREGTPLELKYREKEWVWLHDHFESDLYKPRLSANKTNQEELTDHHHADSKPYEKLFEEAEIDDAQISCVKVYEDTHTR